MRRPGALVLGGDYRGLGIVRSLGRHGIAVWVVHGQDRIACASRYARRSVRRPAGSEDAQVAHLLRLAAEEGLDRCVLFPTDEETAWIVSRHHDELASHYRFTTSPWKRHQLAADKQLAHRCADALDLDVPRTWFPSSRADVEALDVDFPVIIKPAVRLAFNSLTHAKAWRVDDRAALIERYDAAAGMVGSDDVLVQELIPGGGEHQLSFAAACRDGEPVVYATARRTRQYPVDFGRASTFVETVDRPDVLKPAFRLLEELRLDGLVEVELKEDPRDGRLKILDVNARAWGWHSIGAAAGADFAWAAWRIALDLPVRPSVGRPGVRWVRLAIDLPISVGEILAGRLSLRAYLRSLRPPLTGPMAALDDPLPALLDLPLMVFRGLKRVLRSVPTARSSSPSGSITVRRPTRGRPES